MVAAIKSDPLARHSIPDWVDAVARGVIERCWAAAPGARPAFDDIRDTLWSQYCSDGFRGTAAEVYHS